jgi:hypothetical protein
MARAYSLAGELLPGINVAGATEWMGHRPCITDNEYEVAIAAAGSKSKRYRIIFVSNVLDPQRFRLFELPKPAADDAKGPYIVIGRSSVRLRFQFEADAR